jgi:hypothetical protein
MALTGRPDGPPLLAPAPFANAARAAIDALRRLAAKELPTDFDGAALLGERAAIFGLGRRGTIAPGRTCRLLRAADEWLAVNLAREDDRSLVPAWLSEIEDRDESSAPDRDADDGEVLWEWIVRRVRHAPATDLVARARLLGLPAAVAASQVTPSPSHRVAATGTPRSRLPGDAPLVLDLSTLWAGPLCAHLLGLAGARVVKVESHARPDGARRGPAAFYDLLNAGKESVALDLRSAEGREMLRRLIARADVVVESARPRALLQLGIDAAEMVARRPGLTWVSITGYGRAEPGGSWVAFGDDAAVAAGLVVATDSTPLFCGDAIADPLTGVVAAVAAQESWRAGGGTLLDVALRDVVAHVLGSASLCGVASIRACDAPGEWEVVAGSERQRVLPPRARTPTGRARPLGADTERVLQSLGVTC